MKKGLTLRRLLPALLALAAMLAVTIPIAAAAPGSGKASSDGMSRFGRMFGKLDAFPVQPNQTLADVVDGMFDPGFDGLGNQAGPHAAIEDENDNEGVPAGFTYLGQFIDHDLTRDQQPTPTSFIDPTTLTNFRTARFDLDSVYGGGPEQSPQLYDEEVEGK